MVERYVIEVKPKCCLEEKREPKLLERPLGLREKEGSYEELRLLFPVKDKFRIYTCKGLIPLIYTYDRERGIIIVREVLKPLPHGEYEIDSIGGERLRKGTTLGVIYVNPSVYNIVKLERECYTKELIPLKIVFNSVKIRVSDPVKFVSEIWRKYYDLNEEPLKIEIGELILNRLKYTIVNMSVEDIIYNIAQLESSFADYLRENLSGYGIDVVGVDISYLFEKEESFDLYYWHIKHEIPVEYIYLIRLLSNLPPQVYNQVPEIPLILALSIISRKMERFDELLRSLSPLLERISAGKILELVREKTS